MFYKMDSGELLYLIQDTDKIDGFLSISDLESSFQTSYLEII